MRETLFKKGTTIFTYFEYAHPGTEGKLSKRLLAVKTPRLYSHDFSGERSKYKTRSICVEVPEEIKDRLLEDGWGIKVRIPEDERYDPRYYLPVTIKFNEFGPEITKVAPNTPVTYNADTAGVLDSTDMTDIELLITPFHNPDHPGAAKAYLREMRFKLNRSPLDYFDEEDEDEEIPNF